MPSIRVYLAQTPSNGHTSHIIMSKFRTLLLHNPRKRHGLAAGIENTYLQHEPGCLNFCLAGDCGR